MTTSDLVTYSRFLAGDTVAGRFTDGDVIMAVNVSTQQLMLDVAWPEVLLTVTTTTAQEYTLPPVLQIVEAYIGQPGQFGQLLVPTTLTRLEGLPLSLYDQTAVNQQPQWAVAPAMPYPIPNQDLGYPTSAGTTVFSPKMRPVRYLRGGNIGVIPAPLSGAVLTVRAIPFPADLVMLSDVSLFPEHFKRALGCYTAMQLVESDNPEDPQAGLGWYSKYTKEAGRLATWKDRLDFNLDQSPQFVTYRTYFNPPVPHYAAVTTGAPVW